RGSYGIFLSPKQQQQIKIDYPIPNEFYDAGAVGLLRNVFELFKRDDVLSDLVKHLRTQIDKMPVNDRVYYQLALVYLHWWKDEKDEAIQALARTNDAEPANLKLRFELAALREMYGEPAEALTVVDGITPLDQETMQRRETLAMRLAVRT